MTDVASDRQYCRLTVDLDIGALDLDPEARLAPVDELNLEPPRHVLARHALGHVLAEQRAIGGLDEVYGIASLELLRVEPDQAGR